MTAFAVDVVVAGVMSGAVAGIAGTAEHAQQLLQLGDRPLKPVCTAATASRASVGTGTEQPLGDAGLDTHQRDMMGDDIV